MTQKTGTITVRNRRDGAKISKSISWRMRIIIAAFLLPIVYFGLAQAFKLPLPTFPGVNFSGGPAPEYIMFMTYRAESVPGSLGFSLGFTILAFLLMVVVGLKECGYTLQQDIDHLVSGILDAPPSKTSAAIKSADTTP